MDNVFTSPTNTEGDDNIASYLKAADTHNIGNTMGGSWFEPESWGTKFSNAGKYIAVSMLSGADSFYNTGAAVAHWVGIGEGVHDTGEWISSLDNDLGQYYSENRQSADLAGFVIGSIIPGMQGIKILNAGQKALKGVEASGFIGRNLSRTTGLLAPETEMLIKFSGKEIAASSGAVSKFNIATVKALGAGVQQNFLEAAAFEVMVQATMAKSPLLEDQTAQQ